SGGPGAAGRLPELFEPVSYTHEISLSENPPTEKVSYFYALLAMCCLYGGIQGMITVTYMQANLSPLGARTTMAPAGRFRMVTYDLLGGLSLQFLSLTTVVAYIHFVLGVSFGSKLWFVLLTCLAGSLLGVAFGAMVSAASKLGEQAKIAILITVTMVCCFLSGLMVRGINYTVAQKIPAVSWLNPAARIADAFYCLYYYDTYERYFLNIGIIIAMAVVMLAVTAIFVRRQRYESI
ncbi:MAG: ABC transporter permease, partial [Oscillospiraceae bacterium]|nr:ABC transporter permease [Oscillospiraceae bacterium]